MPDAMAALAEIYHDRAQPTRAWKAAGGRVVGYFCDHFPVELVAAAGFLPVRVSGDPAYDREIERKYITPLIPKTFAGVRQSGLEFVNSMAARLIGGQYGDLDFLVISASRKPIMNLFTQLLAAKEAYPNDVRLPPIHILDHAHVPADSARAFNERSLLALKAKLEVWSGCEITEAALSAGITEGNTGRALARRLAALRSANPPKISGADFLTAVGAGMFMPRGQHNARLEALLNDPPDEARLGLRVFVGGSPADNLQLYSAIEAQDATVVAEDHCWGERCADLPIGLEGGALAGSIRRWQTAPPCGLRFPLEASPKDCVARAKTARADCAILSVYRGDEMQVWDTPQEVEALEAAGVPTLHLRDQAYAVDAPALAESLSRFFGAVRSREGALS